MNEICQTIYWTTQPAYNDVHICIDSKKLYNLTFSEQVHMPINDKWYISLN
jgi:hypothetical protein